jgi:hypothetical protein
MKKEQFIKTTDDLFKEYEFLNHTTEGFNIDLKDDYEIDTINEVVNHIKNKQSFWYDLEGTLEHLKIRLLPCVKKSPVCYYTYKNKYGVYVNIYTIMETLLDELQLMVKKRDKDLQDFRIMADKYVKDSDSYYKRGEYYPLCRDYKQILDVAIEKKTDLEEAFKLYIDSLNKYNNISKWKDQIQPIKVEIITFENVFIFIVILFIVFLIFISR